MLEDTAGISLFEINRLQNREWRLLTESIHNNVDGRCLPLRVNDYGYKTMLGFKRIIKM